MRGSGLFLCYCFFFLCIFFPISFLLMFNSCACGHFRNFEQDESTENLLPNGLPGHFVLFCFFVFVFFFLLFFFFLFFVVVVFFFFVVVVFFLIIAATYTETNQTDHLWDR